MITSTKLVKSYTKCILVLIVYIVQFLVHIVYFWGIFDFLSGNSSQLVHLVYFSDFFDFLSGNSPQLVHIVYIGSANVHN